MAFPLKQFVWSETYYTIQDFEKYFRSTFPHFVQIVDGYLLQGEGVHCYASGEAATLPVKPARQENFDDYKRQVLLLAVFYVPDIGQQRRVLVKDTTGRLLSIPHDFKVSFCLADEQGAEQGSSQLISDIVRDISSWDGKKKHVNLSKKKDGVVNFISQTSQYGEPIVKAVDGAMEIVNVYNERFLVAHAIVYDEIQGNPVGIPLTLPLTLTVCEGVTEISMDSLDTLLNRAAKWHEFESFNKHFNVENVLEKNIVVFSEQYVDNDGYATILSTYFTDFEQDQSCSTGVYADIDDKPPAPCRRNEYSYIRSPKDLGSPASTWDKQKNVQSKEGMIESLKSGSLSISHSQSILGRDTTQSKVTQAKRGGNTRKGEDRLEKVLQSGGFDETGNCTPKSVSVKEKLKYATLTTPIEYCDADLRFISMSSKHLPVCKTALCTNRPPAHSNKKQEPFGYHKSVFTKSRSSGNEKADAASSLYMEEARNRPANVGCGWQVKELTHRTVFVGIRHVPSPPPLRTRRWESKTLKPSEYSHATLGSKSGRGRSNEESVENPPKLPPRLAKANTMGRMLYETDREGTF